jgi:hypothetical protein
MFGSIEAISRHRRGRPPAGAFCARATRGQITAARPSADMNCRRLMSIAICPVPTGFMPAAIWGQEYHTRTLGLFPASRCSGGKAARYFVALREAVHGPYVWTGRALQAENDDLEKVGLALLYPAY